MEEGEKEKAREGGRETGREGGGGEGGKEESYLIKSFLHCVCVYCGAHLNVTKKTGAG